LRVLREHSVSASGLVKLVALGRRVDLLGALGVEWANLRYFGRYLLGWSVKQGRIESLVDETRSSALAFSEFRLLLSLSLLLKDLLGFHQLL
jgi:hypothetical protein